MSFLDDLTRGGGVEQVVEVSIRHSSMLCCFGMVDVVMFMFSNDKVMSTCMSVPGILRSWSDPSSPLDSNFAHFA